MNLYAEHQDEDAGVDPRWQTLIAKLEMVGTGMLATMLIVAVMYGLLAVGAR
jgi:hypothetical protein